ncbi:MAG: hypothetical protein AAF358_05885 [Pseudomonadota bacterium]
MSDELDKLRPFPTVVKDRVFDDPREIRRWALSQEFLDCEAFNARHGTQESWPGSRGPSLHATHEQFVTQFTAFVLSDVLRFPPTNFRCNCSFQLTLAGDGDSWVHRDAQLYRLAGLVYLTPRAPLDGGTLFYQETNPGEYEITDVIANRFNRLLVFDTQVPHKSHQYFGEGKEDGRLTMPFFINFELKED